MTFFLRVLLCIVCIIPSSLDSFAEYSPVPENNPPILADLYHKGVRACSQLERSVEIKKRLLRRLRRLSTSWVSHVYFLHCEQPDWQDFQAHRETFCSLFSAFRSILHLFLERAQETQKNIEHRQSLCCRLTKELRIVKVILQREDSRFDIEGLLDKKEDLPKS